MDEDNTQLRDSLISQADTAFLTLAEQINELLDATQFYSDLHPVKTQSDMMKTEALQGAVKDMAKLLKLLALEIERWKKEEERILSKMGVELQYLNELKATIEAVMLFLEREGIPLPQFEIGLINQSYTELIRCNSLL